VSVHLSDSEGYGITLAECILYGLPSVVSGFPSIVDFEDCELLFKCNLNVNDVLNAMIKASALSPNNELNYCDMFSEISVIKGFLNNIELLKL